MGGGGQKYLPLGEQIQTVLKRLWPDGRGLCDLYSDTYHPSLLTLLEQAEPIGDMLQRRPTLSVAGRQVLVSTRTLYISAGAVASCSGVSDSDLNALLKAVVFDRR